uniref:Rhamnogalacturonan lyase n=1 Tax=Gracilibacillus caseinilyticus TaxID=2932256 RepID=A0ABY4EVZ8_9BACI|nr:rhamnogalacturonan lyase [Gracilibacillus caseinilyticus]UOQ48592.1 rhamnogalacturonan lyase [Gracilibacillus caseinilyticus]
MKNKKKPKHVLIFVAIFSLIFNFSVISAVAAEEMPDVDGFQGVYYTDFGDSGEVTPENWGFNTSAATLSTNTEDVAGNETAKLQFDVVDQSGGRVATKTLDTNVMGEKVLVTFDWYPGKSNDKGEHLYENGGEFRILDGAGNTVFTINSTNKEAITYYAGDQEQTATSFTDQETWYHMSVTFDLASNDVSLDMENQATGVKESYQSSLDEVDFDGNVSTLRLVGVRTSGNNHTWTTYLDNVGIYHVPINDNTITNVPSLPYERVYVGDTTADINSIGLPEKVEVALADHSTTEAAISEWQAVGKEWDPEQSGVYEFSGTIADSAEIDNAFDRKATVYVYNRLTPPETNRATEWLDRGTVALQTDDGIFLSWRLLVDEYDKDVKFRVYRNGKRLNHDLLSVTNFTDENGSADDHYSIVTVANGKIIERNKVSVEENNYLSLPLQKPEGGTTATGDYTYSANDASVGDLDGDGEYEVILKWRPSNAMTALEDVITGPTIFDAYELDGTLLWRMNMGMNLTSGPQYHQFVVADMNSDGKSEFLIKTADATTTYGVTDGKYDSSKKVSVIGNEEDNGEWINEGGHVVDGPEYISVFAGDTGKEIDTIDFAFPVEKEEGDHGASWGDTFYNRSDRFLSGVAYIDGKKPSAIYGRGYYERTAFAAYSLENGELIEDWTFDSDEAGRGASLGNHNLATGDVDNDGFDEIVAGSLTLDHDGSILYAMDGDMGRVQGSHGDALHLGAFDPNREGLHVFGVRESSEVASLEYHDGATGESLQAYYAFKDAGRGVAGNITSSPGYEIWGAGGGTVETGGGVYNVNGDVVTNSFRDIGLPVNFVSYWDGDLMNEMLDGTTISKYDESANQVNVLESFEGVVSNNGTKANPALQADILGDWREEAIYPTEDSTELRIFTTTISTDYRLPTLMHDSVYRMGIAWQNTTYNQPPHLGYYLGEDIRDQVLNGELDFPEVDYTPSLQALEHSLAMSVNAHSEKVLFNKLKQVKHHLSKDHQKQAIKHMNDFIKHLRKSDLADEQVSSLTADAQDLIAQWSE